MPHIFFVSFFTIYFLWTSRWVSRLCSVGSIEVGIDQRSAVFRDGVMTKRNTRKILFRRVNAVEAHVSWMSWNKCRVSVATYGINWLVRRSKFSRTSGSEMGMTYKGARARRVSLPGQAYPVHSEESPANLVYVQLVTWPWPRLAVEYWSASSETLKRFASLCKISSKPFKPAFLLEPSRTQPGTSRGPL